MKADEARPHYEALYTAYQRLEDVILEDLKAQIRPDDLTHVHEDPGGRASAFNEGARMVWCGPDPTPPGGWPCMSCAGVTSSVSTLN